MIFIEKFEKNVSLKMILIGDSGVGKTSLMHRFVENKFNNRYKATVGVDFLTKKVILKNGYSATVQIWDTAGQERYQGLGKAFYRGVDCCVLTYDITDPVTFRNLEFWYQDFMTLNNSKLDKNIPFVVIGNKTDSNSHRKISKEIAEDWCKQKDFPYFETNVGDGTNVNEAFGTAINLAYERIKFVYEDFVIYESIKFYKDSKKKDNKLKAKLCSF